MNKIYFHRGHTIMRNSLENGFKWTTFEDDDLFANSINDLKNLIDKKTGGFATSQIPKRMQKELK